VAAIHHQIAFLAPPAVGRKHILQIFFFGGLGRKDSDK